VTRFGFVLDQGRCIGCHACTVACKTEHGVELGVFRTWVKYIEHGEFPDLRRSFTVLRCNHCTDAPCVEICPVESLYRREDGIVDFDPTRCIGCKACLNACPYDALYIDPESHTAAKCNFCAHRVDAGMQPACEVVCPTDAIVSGDLDDPGSAVHQILQVTSHEVRAPEQGTRPNVFYIGAEHADLNPLEVGSAGAYLTAELDPTQAEKLGPLTPTAAAHATYDIPHPPPWGWRVSSYFLSKGIAAGAMMLAPILLAIRSDGAAISGYVPGGLALAGIALTVLLLILDLKQPRRFHYLLTRPQWRSWLTRGVHCINIAALLALIFTISAVLGWHRLRDFTGWLLVPGALALAGYTAFLFAQCEGRDLWQSPLLLPHTLVNAVLAGAAALGVSYAFTGDPAAFGRALAGVLIGSAALAGALIALDLFVRTHTSQAARAATNLYRDLFAWRFWLGGIVTGLVGPMALASGYLIIGHGAGLLAVGGVLALAGLWLYEDAWVRAGQSVPLS
jgi:Fe-S-cluster-containing dehydrogenase component/formate-dependent nitrite reductase membrane component NrfD